MTPEDARAIEPGTTPGPWTARHGSDNTSYVREEEWFSAIGSAEFGHVDAEYTPADANLIAAAPDMRATIAAQTWQWGRLGGGGVEWHNTEAAARQHVAVARGGLVRRPVGPVEVVE